MSFKVAFGGDVVDFTKLLGTLSAQHLFDLAEFPDVELALFPFAISIFCAVKRPSCIRHLDQDVVERLASDLSIGWCPPQSIRIRIQ